MEKGKRSAQCFATIIFDDARDSCTEYGGLLRLRIQRQDLLIQQISTYMSSSADAENMQVVSTGSGTLKEVVTLQWLMD